MPWFDDERSMAAGLAAGLEIEGFDVDIAYNGVDGLSRAREHTYDIILLDVMLPGLDGYSVCKALRAEQIWTPILMLTARDAERDGLTGLHAGADDYLTKPFSYAVLVARMRALLRRGPPQQGETDPGPRLGPRLRRRHQHRRGVHRTPAQQGGPPLRAGDHRDPSRRGLPPGGPP